MPKPGAQLSINNAKANVSLFRIKCCHGTADFVLYSSMVNTTAGVCIPTRCGWVRKPFPHMARDEDLSLAVLQGAGLSRVGLYQPSVLGRWPPLHTLGSTKAQ